MSFTLRSCQLIAAEHGQKRPGEIQAHIAKETGEPGNEYRIRSL